MLRTGIRKANSAGVFTTTGTAAVPVADLLHVLGTNRSAVRRSAWIRKIVAYNNTGGNVPLQFGTIDLAAAFVALMPDLVALNGIENIWEEAQLPNVEFIADRQAGALGRTGDVYVSSIGLAAGVLILLEVEEIGS